MRVLKEVVVAGKGKVKISFSSSNLGQIPALVYQIHFLTEKKGKFQFPFNLPPDSSTRY